MARKLTRRRFSRLLIGTLGGTALPLLTSRDQVKALEYCYWQKVSGPVCNYNRELVERWCYRCCAGTDCWYEWCETRIVGSC
jgi:hypothetical protein